jgi:hypothetical protein
MNLFKSKVSSFILSFILFPVISVSYAADPASSLNIREYEDDGVYMRLVVRNSDQLSGFYLARQFPQKAIDEILKTCFITPIILNKKFEFLHIDIDSWSIIVDGKPVERIRRDYWIDKWQAVGLSLAHQATFGWTLMPEARDLRLDESAGGNIVFPHQSKPFTLNAHFKTGMAKQGKIKTVIFEDVSCAK